MTQKAQQLSNPEMYEVIFNSVGEGVIVANKNGEIVLANPRANELFGYASNELLGLKVEQLVPKEVRERHTDHRANYQKKPHKRQMGGNMNLSGLRKDGSFFDVEISLNHFENNDQQYVVAVITDVSERVVQQKEIQELNLNLEKKVEERTQEVLESQKLYSAIAQNFPNGTINVFDQELNYIFVEGLELRELGIDPSKLIGTNYLKKVNKEVQEKLKKELLTVFKGNSNQFEIVLNDQTYSVNAVPLSISKGVVDKILVVEENITVQKEIELQKEAALAKEKRLNEMKSRFVSMASHEFRTPLSTVLSSIALIEKHIEKGSLDKTEKHTQRIRKSVAGLTEILNDFLSIEKLESEILTAKITQIDFQKFCLEIKEELETITKKGQVLNINIEGETAIQSDPQILKNVCYNLISNAIKYSKEDSEITIQAKVTQDDLNISIQDKGIGIPHEEQKEMFNRFFRAKNVTNIKGTGLGLSIVKKYVELLDGKIWFESELNVGTTFFVQIPLNHE